VCRFAFRFRPFPFLAHPFLFVVLGTRIPCSAAQAEHAVDNSASLAELEVHATAGEAAAQFQLAFYLFQRGHPPDYSSILTWLNSSAAQHYARAQCMLGYLYEKGLGVPRDYAKRLKIIAPPHSKGIPLRKTISGISITRGAESRKICTLPSSGIALRPKMEM
jgi:Sel1 repeat